MDEFEKLPCWGTKQYILFFLRVHGIENPFDEGYSFCELAYFAN